MIRMFCAALLLSMPAVAAAHNELGFEDIIFFNQGSCQDTAGQIRAMLQEENRNYEIFCEEQADGTWRLHVHQRD